MRVAIVSAVHDEEKYISRMIESLLTQTRMPDEIVLVDDGSKDGTAKVVEQYASHYSVIRFVRNANQGPAVSRNIAWRAAQADIVIFTDGDCVPDRDWVEKLLKRFTSDTIAAVAGTYRTLNDKYILSRFIGHEIAWRYRAVLGEVDAHGAYNLALRKSVLDEMNGFEESYTAPSGEDWDLTYRISRKYKIIFAPDAIVAHAHPEKFWPYMKNQARRGFDRIKLYKAHPDKIKGDVYTGKIVKYQVLAAGLLPFTIMLLPFRGLRVLPIVLLIFLLGSCWNVFNFSFQRDPAAAFYGVVVQFVRCFAWAWGALKGLWRFGLQGEK